MPHGAKIIKAVMKDVVSDVLFYAESSHRERILASVAQQINAFHAEFANAYPESAGNLHIIAHSLGGVVAYDLLCAQGPGALSPGTDMPKLACAPQNLFICGSPLGLFLSIRGRGRGGCGSANAGAPGGDGANSTMISPETGCLGATRCRNVIHPLDVLAYRLEPLLFESSAPPAAPPPASPSHEDCVQGECICK